MKAAIADVIAKEGASGMKDMGKVMASLKERLCRQDGFRQGERRGEEFARGLTRMAHSIRPFLMFQKKDAEAAMRFYVSLFSDGKMP